MRTATHGSPSPPQTGGSAPSPDCIAPGAPPSRPSASPSTPTCRSHTPDAPASLPHRLVADSSHSRRPTAPYPRYRSLAVPPYRRTDSSTSPASITPPARCPSACTANDPPGTPGPAARRLLPPSTLPAFPRSSPPRAPHRSPPADPASLPLLSVAPPAGSLS